MLYYYKSPDNKMYGYVTDQSQIPAGMVPISKAAYDALVAAAQGAVAPVTQVNMGSPVRPAQGAVVFSWDDGWDSHPVVAQMHTARGQRATFYITRNLLGTAQHLTPGDLPALVAQGHEVGYHGADHLDMSVMTVPDRAVQWAAVGDVEAAVGNGYKITSHAYPYGVNSLATNSEAYGRFDRVAAISLSQGYYTSTSGFGPYLYEPGFEGFRHGRFPWSQTTHAQFMRLLKDYVSKRGVILTVYAHQIGNPDTPTMDQVKEALDYCATAGIPAITAREAFAGPKMVNPLFDSGLDGWTVVKAGAAAGAGSTVDVATDAPGNGYPGSNSLRIVSANTTTVNDSVHVFQTIPVQPNRNYSLSGRVKQEGSAGAGKFSVRINEFNEAGGSVASRSVRGSAATGFWGQSSAAPTDATFGAAWVGRTHPDTRYATVGFYLQELTGTFYGSHLYFGPTEEGLLG